MASLRPVFVIAALVMFTGPAAAFPLRPVDAMIERVASKYDSAPRLKDIRARMVADKPVSIEELKMLADVGDGLAAYAFAQRLMALNRTDLHGQAAQYFAIAIDKGRDYAVAPLVAILSDPNSVLVPVRLAHIETTLERQAAAGNPAAVVALARLYMQGYPFGAEPEKARILLRAHSTMDIDGEDALDMAMIIASRPPLGPEDVAALRNYLLTAARSPELGTRTAAENLLRRFPEGEDEDG